jgi:hypothetical protein
MAYCNISDAFNINQKFDQTVKGLQSFNPSKYELSNMRNSYGTLNSVENENEMSYGAPFNDDQSLNGTDLSNLLSENQSKNQINTQENSKPKLTHRDCINIYTSPKNHSDDIISNALKHITKCPLCKNEIKNIQKNFMENTSALSISELDQAKESRQTSALGKMCGTATNSIPAIMTFSQDNVQQQAPIQSQMQIPVQPIQSLYTVPSVSQESAVMIENKLKMLSDKINEENNLKYQNAVLQNTISKYIEDAEEKKQINSKMDRILNMLQQNQINSNIQKENFNNYGFRPEHFQSMNNSNSIDFLTIGIIVIIILLIVDIYLRIKQNVKTE